MSENCSFSLGELFCGPGGMAIAAARTMPVTTLSRQATYTLRHSWGVDFSKSAIETFNANLDNQGIHMDAWEFVNKHLDSAHRVNALAFGFPCNSFSEVGERKGVHDEKFGNLYQTGIKVIETYNVEWFVAENVSGINARDKGRQFKKILRELSAAGVGYDVTAHLYKFEEYGVPQARHRYVIVGIRHDIAEKRHLVFRPPAPTHGPGRIPFVTASDALSVVKNHTKWGGDFTRQSEKVVWRLKFTSPGENAWKLDELVDEVRYPDDRLLKYLKALPWYRADIAPLGSLAEIRRKIEECRLHCSRARMSHIYRRLRADKPAYTLTGSGGGGTHVYHWNEHRALTNEERAALQSFPEDFAFSGTSEQIRKQIGMAVPTKGAKLIFESILKTFAGVEYPYVEPNPELVVKPQNCD